MKLGIKDSADGRSMKKLLLTCILIASIIFIAGCIGEEKTNTGTPTSHQVNQESDNQAPDLIIKPSDVPRLTLVDHSFIAVSKSSIYTFKNESYTKEYAYQDVLPLGTRNVGQSSIWGDGSGRSVIIRLDRYDSDVPIKDFKVDFTYTTEGIQKFKEMGVDCIGDPNIGDFSNYESFPYQTLDIKRTKLHFAYENYHVSLCVIDEKDKSLNEAIRIAKIIESRLD